MKYSNHCKWFDGIVAAVLMSAVISSVCWAVPNPPSSVKIQSIGSTSMTVTWGRNGNPPDTVFYNVYTFSPDSTVYIGVTKTYGTSMEVFGLTPEKDYYFGVEAVEEGGLASPTVGTSTKFTTPRYFKANGTNLLDGDVISVRPSLIFTIPSISLNMGTCKVLVDGVQIGTYDTSTPTTDATIINFTAKTAIPQGTHTLAINVNDAEGSTYSQTAMGLRVLGPEIKFDINPLFYPNPYDPVAGTGKIAYSLTGNTPLKIYFINMVGKIAHLITINEGDEGGHAGYNEVIWDGKPDGETYLSNDVYLAVFVSGGGEVLGRSKVMILKSGN